jgi:hypothetical protein
MIISHGLLFYNLSVFELDKTVTNEIYVIKGSNKGELESYV